MGTASARHLPEWDVQFGVRNYSTGVSLHAVSAALAFAVALLATRELGPAQYGMVAATLAATQLVCAFTIQWSGHGLGRLGCEEFVDTGSLQRTFWSRVWILCASLLVVLATAPLWYPAVATYFRLPQTLRPLLFVNLIAIALWLHMQQALLAAKRPRITATLLVAERLAVFALVVALLMRSRLSPLTVICAYVAGAIVPTLIGLWMLRPMLGRPQLIDGIAGRRLLRFSLPLVPTLWIAVGGSHFIDALFVAHFLGLAQLAIYSIAAQIAGVFSQLPLLFGALLLPYFVSAERSGSAQRMRDYLTDWLPPIALGWSLLCVFAGAIAQALVIPVFGAAFEAAAPLIWPLLAASAASAPWVMGLAAAASTREQTRLHAFTTATSASVNIALNLVLIPRFGLLGCAWATAGAFAAAAAVGSASAHRIVGVRTLGSLLACTPVVVAALFGSLGFAPWQCLLAAALPAIPLWRRHGPRLLQLIAHLIPRALHTAPSVPLHVRD